jgi:hypothetical protein
VHALYSSQLRDIGTGGAERVVICYMLPILAESNAEFGICPPPPIRNKSNVLVRSVSIVQGKQA